MGKHIRKAKEQLRKQQKEGGFTISDRDEVKFSKKDIENIKIAVNKLRGTRRK